ncbi:multicopper oxidase domain-containing protein [Salinispora arenicola]|nr:multicopper oxidase domain-containing protein [Salinispora arenicola]
MRAPPPSWRCETVRTDLSGAVRTGVSTGQRSRQQLGYHDTVLALPGEITRIKSFFDLPGRYIWHCHILEHEDHEMMRPINIGPATDPTHAATTTTPTSESRHPSDSPDHRHDQR